MDDPALERLRHIKNQLAVLLTRWRSGAPQQVLEVCSLAARGSSKHTVASMWGDVCLFGLSRSRVFRGSQLPTAQLGNDIRVHLGAGRALHGTLGRPGLARAEAKTIGFSSGATARAAAPARVWTLECPGS